MATIEITDDNIEQTLSKEGIVLIDFWAEWCNPCRMFGPIFERSSESHKEIVFGKVDTDAQQGLAAAFQIQSIPTLVAARDGVIVFKQSGVLSEKNLSELVQAISNLDMAEVKEKIKHQDHN